MKKAVIIVTSLFFTLIMQAQDRTQPKPGPAPKININNENLAQYSDELTGNIILSIDNVKATNVETVSKLLNNKDEKQSTRIEMIKKNRKVIQIII